MSAAPGTLIMTIRHGEKPAGAIASQPGPILISWQHGEIPAIAAAFGSVTPTPPTSWPDDRFDMVWTFTATDRGWNFAQVPEMALPGDNPIAFP